MSKDKLKQLRHQVGENEDFQSESNQLAPNSVGENNILARFSTKLSHIKQNTKHKLKSIIYITLILGFIFYTTSLAVSISNRIPKITSSGQDLAVKITKLINTIRNNGGFEAGIKEVESSLKNLQSDLSDIDKKLWPIFSTTDLTQESWNLGKEWIEASSNLLKFRLTPEGIVSKLNRNFTQYLADFFNELPSLFLKSKSFISKIKFLLSWSILVSNKNISAVWTYIELAEDFLDIMQDIYTLRTGILEFLGYNSVHKILIFNQNIAESRPTGGFIGSYLPVNITEGRFDIGQSQSIYNIDDNNTKSLLSFPASWYYDLQYGRFNSHGIRNLNYYSCFRDSASIIESEFSQSNRGQSADTVMFLTPNLIKNIFSDDTKLRIEPSLIYTDRELIDKSNEEIIITKENFYEVIERLTALEYNDPTNPKSAITPILMSIFSNLDKILNDQDLVRIILDTLETGFTRDVQIWSKDQPLEKVWEELNFSGNSTCVSDNQGLKVDYKLAFLQANLSSDKRDYFARHNFSISSSNEADANKIEIHYQRSYKNLDKLQRKYNSKNGLTFLAFQLPSDAFDYSLKSEQSLKIPFERPFYKLKVAESEEKEIYIPKVIQDTLNSATDITPTSFVYFQPDNSFVLGTYINEDDSENSTLKLEFKTKQNVLSFYPAPAINNTSITSSQNTFMIDYLDPEHKPVNSLNSRGQGIAIVLN